MKKCRVWKVKEKRHWFSGNSAPQGMWIGWCDQCNKRTGQYWSFGATLGATLYHITVHHRRI